MSGRTHSPSSALTEGKASPRRFNAGRKAHPRRTLEDDSDMVRSHQQGDAPRLP